jgi:hypothetical protein
MELSPKCMGDNVLDYLPSDYYRLVEDQRVNWKLAYTTFASKAENGKYSGLCNKHLV